MMFTSAALTLCAGSFGYWKTKSKPSLIGGAALASVFLSAAVIVRRTEYQASGHALAAAAGAVALVLGAKRASMAKKPGVGPATLLLVGLLNVPYMSMKAFEWAQ